MTKKTFLFLALFSTPVWGQETPTTPAPPAGPTPLELKEAFDKGFQEGHHKGYFQGGEAGRVEGARAGESQGREEGTREGRDKGQKEGYQEGHRSGYSRGQSNGANKGGFEKGQQEGYQEGHANGTREGQQVGYREGYSKAQKEFENDIVTKNSPGNIAGSEGGNSNTANPPGNGGGADPFGGINLNGTADHNSNPYAGNGGHRDHPSGPYSDPQLKQKYAEGFRNGHDTGYRKGYDEKYWQHKREEHRRAYDMAYQMAFAQARTYGYQQGFDEGYKQGEEDEYRRQYKKGHDEGMSRGYREGYDPSYKQYFEAGFQEAVALYSGSAVLSFEEAYLYDENSDAIFAPGESITLSVTLANFGKADSLEGLEIKVLNKINDLFVSGNGQIEKVEAATRETFTTGITLRFGQEAPLNKAFMVPVEVKYQGKSLGIRTLEVNLQNAFIVEKVDAGKGIFAGKDLGIKISVRNISRKGSEGDVSVTLSTEDSFATLKSTKVILGQIKPKSSLSAGEKLTLQFGENTPLFHNARFQLTLRDGDRLVGSEKFTLVVSREFKSRPDSALLVVLPTVQDPSSLKVMNTLQKLNLQFDFWDIEDRGAIDSAILGNYSNRMAVMISSENQSGEANSNLAGDFLKRGGRLLFAGKGSQGFVRDYLFSDANGSRPQTATGQDFLHGINFSVSNGQGLKPNRPSQSILDGSNGSLALKTFSEEGQKEDKVNYRAVYFSPNLLEVTDQSAEMVLVKSIYWLLDFKAKMDFADRLISKKGLANPADGVISWNLSELNLAMYYELRDEMDRTDRQGLFGSYPTPKMDKWGSWVRNNSSHFKSCFQLLWEYKDSVDGLMKRGHMKKVLKKVKESAGF